MVRSRAIQCRQWNSVLPNNVNFAGPRSGSGSLECAIYAAAEHVFLWVSSPNGTLAYTFNSPDFFAVSELDLQKQRQFIKQGSERYKRPQPVAVNASIGQSGPRGELVLFDGAGSRHDVVQLPGGIGPAIRRKGRDLNTPIAKVGVGPDGYPLFFDRQGDSIEYDRVAKPLLIGEDGDLIFVTPRTIISSGRTFFLDEMDRAIAAEPGQAENHFVLMTQDASVVYYVIYTNDVYAYFHSGVRNNAIKASYFPTSSRELKEIRAYAFSHGIRRISDEKALVVELKTSWIEVPDNQVSIYSRRHILMDGIVPKYDMSGAPYRWVQNGTKPIKLAMIGMHVAFSIPGISDLVWANVRTRP